MLRYGLTIVGLAWLLCADVALACEQCLGAGGANGPTIRALVYSMASLLVMIGSVGTGIGAFFLHIWRRSRMLEPIEWTVDEDGGLARRNSATNGEG